MGPQEIDVDLLNEYNAEVSRLEGEARQQAYQRLARARAELEEAMREVSGPPAVPSFEEWKAARPLDVGDVVGG